MNNYYIYLLIFIIFLSSCFKKEEPIVPPMLSESTQERGVKVEKPLTKRKRVALVIGNGNYRFSPLKNPINDAKDMTNSLRNLGFKVIHKENVSRESMDYAIEDFKLLLGKRTVGLFYFSGHGVQFKNQNYLIPTDIKNISLPKVEYRSIALGYVLSEMEDAKNYMNIIILDACRDNPFMSKYRNFKKGLVVQNDTEQAGTLIAYATSPNNVANDGNGHNSPYTKHLLKYIHQPGLPIEMMFKRIRNSVMTETRRQQIPWESSSLYGKDFYFAGKISKEEQKRREEIDTLEKKAKKIQEKLKKLKGKKQIKKIPIKVQKIDKQAERHKIVITNW
jgi:uncharacterized caspase-like protein